MLSPSFTSKVLDTSTLANFYKACGDELRLNILRVLKHESYGVLELCEIFNARQSSMSHHLKVLTNAQLLATKKEGNTIYYRRAMVTNTLSSAYHSALLKSVDCLPIPQVCIAGLQRVDNSRRQESYAFFEKNSAQFREQQELIVQYEQYANYLQDILQQLDSSPHALEIGPGEGAFLALLSEHFSEVTALDNSRAMLDKAQLFCQQKALSNINFILGDTQLAITEGVQTHFVAMNMVLHHVPSPAKMLSDCQQLLAPKGKLLISELCQHDQPWVQSACGDLWQGFTPEELISWAKDAQFNSLHSQFLALRNGFQVQIHLLENNAC